MSNDELYNKALKAITELFNDDSVSIEKAKENLEGLEGEIVTMTESLDQNLDFGG